MLKDVNYPDATSSGFVWRSFVSVTYQSVPVGNDKTNGRIIHSIWWLGVSLTGAVLCAEPLNAIHSGLHVVMTG